MKSFVVTGGAGFLGRHICCELLKSEENVVYCIDSVVTGSMNNIQSFLSSSRFHFIEYNINGGFDAMASDGTLPSDIYAIYHLACIASPPTYKKYALDTLNTSYIGTRNVLDLALRTKAKVLFTSTSEVYGDPLVHPQPEEYFGNVNTVGERSCYDEGKRAAETLMYEYRRAYKLDLKIVRIFNTYGPYMDIDDGRVITNFIKQIREDKPLVIYGDGNQGRSFCYVDDMIDGFIKMMNSKSEISGPINLGNPNEFTILELAEKVIALIGGKSKIVFKDLPIDDPKMRQPDITIAKNLLDWHPQISLDHGLDLTTQYFKKLLTS